MTVHMALQVLSHSVTSPVKHHLQATFHANLGSWLQQQQQRQQVPILTSSTAHPASVLFFGKAAVSFGALAVVLVVSVIS